MKQIKSTKELEAHLKEKIAEKPDENYHKLTGTIFAIYRPSRYVWEFMTTM